jgi:hypothetical protein
MHYATLLLEGSKRRAHSGVAGRIGNPLHHFADGGFAALKEEVHDLPLSAAETSKLVVVGHARTCLE